MKQTAAEDQLYDLSYRAEKKRLTDQEANALRDAIRTLGDQRRKADATAEGLRDRVRELKNEAVQARQDAGQATADSDVLQVPCERCSAQSGQPCTPTDGDHITTPHTARLNAARKEN